MTFGSLFAGIGGLDLGLERAGMECKWQVEIDPYCRAVLEKHWPEVPRWDDATTFPPYPFDTRSPRARQRDEHEGKEAFSGDPFGKWRVDLICGGFPCQPVSRAGQRRGLQDERWLWGEFARIIRLVAPRYVLVENVSGILDRALAQVLGDLSDLGFDAEWGTLPAAFFGAPHYRGRVFVVAYAHTEGRQDTAWRSGQAESPRWRILTPTALESRSQHWPSEPTVGRVVHGVSGWMVERLGNAVVPQVAEWIGRRILEADEALRFGVRTGTVEVGR